MEFGLSLSIILPTSLHHHRSIALCSTHDSLPLSFTIPSCFVMIFVCIGQNAGLFLFFPTSARAKLVLFIMYSMIKCITKLSYL